MLKGLNKVNSDIAPDFIAEHRKKLYLPRLYVSPELKYQVRWEEQYQRLQAYLCSAQFYEGIFKRIKLQNLVFCMIFVRYVTAKARMKGEPSFNRLKWGITEALRLKL